MATTATTQKKLRRIAILTSGGDAPGMNAAIRAAARTAQSPFFRIFDFINILL